MNAPPALIAVFLPAGIFAAWLYLRKDADIEQRIDTREAIHARESAEFDRDFAKLAGEKEDEEVAKERAKAAEKRLFIAKQKMDEMAKSDQRGAVREGVDDFLKPKPEENKK